MSKYKNPQIYHFQVSKKNNKIINQINTMNKLFDDKIDKNEKKESFKNIKKDLKSISTKNDLKKKYCKSIIKQSIKQKKKNNNNNNNQNICSSNCILPTNCTDTKDEDRKLKKTFIETEESFNKKEEMNLCYLGNLFRTSNLKKTIVIDGNGNNNLNLKKEFLNLEGNEYKKRSTFPINNSPLTHKKLESDNLYLLNKNKLIFEQDELRLKEYGMIFNLLNDNIEEMKNMFNEKKDTKIKEINKNDINKKKNIKNNNDNIIFTEKERKEINQNETDIEISNEIIKGNSFLESCIQDEFYISLINNQNNQNQNNQNQNNQNYSFEFSSVLNNNINDKTRNILNISNEDLEKTECEIDNYDNENYINHIKKNAFNPRFLLDKKTKKINTISKTKTEKCTIF